MKKLETIALAALIFVLALLMAPSAAAHGSRTAYVEIVEIAPGRATVHVRVNVPSPSVALTADVCTIDPFGDAQSPFDRSSLLVCPTGLRGAALELHGLGPIIDEAVAWTSFADGSTESALLRAGSATFTLRASTSRWDVARSYVALGVRHILTGYDHLLFLVLLCLVLRDARSVLLAETAFTASHSVSFGATALGWIHVSSVAAEACIALSLVLLALDAERRDGRRVSRWAGAGMALVFGLVHGLGFAGGLREIGVPDGAAGVALVGFGAGVELGQIAFLAALLLALHAARDARALPRTKLATVYAAGSLSAYWLVDRAIPLFVHR